MNLLLAEKNQSAAYVPGGWMDHVVGMSAPSPGTFVAAGCAATAYTYD
jgi:hypothetical protein